MKRMVSGLLALLLALSVLFTAPVAVEPALAEGGRTYDLGGAQSGWLISEEDGAKERADGACRISFAGSGVTYTLTADGALTSSNPDSPLLPPVDGNAVSVHLAWEIKTSRLSPEDTLVYHLPANIAWNVYELQGEGGVYDVADGGATEIGWYTIQPDGAISVRYYDHFVERNNKFSYLDITGTVWRSQNADWANTRFSFPGMGDIAHGTIPEQVPVPILKLGIRDNQSYDNYDNWTIFVNTDTKTADVPGSLYDTVPSVAGMTLRDEMYPQGSSTPFSPDFILQNLKAGSFKVWIKNWDANDSAWQLLDAARTQEIREAIFTEDGYVIPAGLGDKSFRITYDTNSNLRGMDSYGYSYDDREDNYVSIGENRVKGILQVPEVGKKVISDGTGDDIGGKDEDGKYEEDELDIVNIGEALSYSIEFSIPEKGFSWEDPEQPTLVKPDKTGKKLVHHRVVINAVFKDMPWPTWYHVTWGEQEEFVTGSLSVKYYQTNGGESSYSIRNYYPISNTQIAAPVDGVSNSQSAQHSPGILYYRLNQKKGLWLDSGTSRLRFGNDGQGSNMSLLLGGAKHGQYTIEWDTEITDYQPTYGFEYVEKLISWTDPVYSQYEFALNTSPGNQGNMNKVSYKYSWNPDTSMFDWHYTKYRVTRGMEIEKTCLTPHADIDLTDRELAWEITVSALPENLWFKNGFTPVVVSDQYTPGLMALVPGSLTVLQNGAEAAAAAYSGPELTMAEGKESGFRVTLDYNHLDCSKPVVLRYKTKALRLETNFSYQNTVQVTADDETESSDAKWGNIHPSISKAGTYYPQDASRIQPVDAGNILWTLTVGPLPEVLQDKVLILKDVLGTSNLKHRMLPDDASDFTVYQEANAPIADALTYTGNGGAQFELGLDISKLDRTKSTYIVFQTTPEMIDQNKTYPNTVDLVYRGPDPDTGRTEDNVLVTGRGSVSVPAVSTVKSVLYNGSYRGVASTRGNLLWAIQVDPLPKHVDGTILQLDDVFAPASGTVGVSALDTESFRVYQTNGPSDSLGSLTPIEGAFSVTPKAEHGGYTATLDYSRLAYGKYTYILYETTPELFRGTKQYRNTAALSYVDITDGDTEKTISTASTSTQVTINEILTKRAGAYNAEDATVPAPAKGNIIWVISLNEMPVTYADRVLTFEDTFASNLPGKGMALVTDSFRVYQLPLNAVFNQAAATEANQVSGAIVGMTPKDAAGREGFTLQLDMSRLDRTKKTYIVYETLPDYQNAGEENVSVKYTNTVKYPDYDERSAVCTVTQDYLQKGHVYGDLSAYVDYTVRINSDGLRLNLYDENGQVKSRGDTVTLKDKTGAAITIVEDTISFNGVAGCSYELDESGHLLSVTVPDATPVLLTYRGYLYPGTPELTGGTDGSGTNYIVLEGEAEQDWVDEETGKVHRSYARGGGDTRSLRILKRDAFTDAPMAGVPFRVDVYGLNAEQTQLVSENLQYSLVTDASGLTEEINVRNDCLYVFTETATPAGYAAHPDSWYVFYPENTHPDFSALRLNGKAIRLSAPAPLVPDGSRVQLTVQNDPILSVTVAKVWEDANNQDGKRPVSLTVRLHADGAEKASAVLSGENGWQHTFEKLLKYNGEKEIVYTVTEDQTEGYTEEIIGQTSSHVTLRNSYTPGKVNISVSKVWDDAEDQDGKRPTGVTVWLLADGERTDFRRLNREDGWTATFAGLDEMQDGKRVAYSVEEEAMPGYTVTLSGDAVTGYTLTNSRPAELTQVRVTKHWEDEENRDGKRPESVTVRLHADGTEKDAAVLSEENAWQHTFENLPKFADGQEIVYTVTEDRVEDYSEEILGQATPEVTLINRYAPGTVDVTVTKAWEDHHDRDGKRPESVTVRLLADGEDTGKTMTLTRENGWTATFAGLDEMLDGQPIEYTVKEEEIAGYRASVSGTHETGFTVTNELLPTETQVQVSKVWAGDEGQEESRPESVSVRLYADGEEAGTALLSAENDWRHVFENLPKYQEDALISYTVEEEAVQAYAAEVTGDAENGFVITNTREETPEPSESPEPENTPEPVPPPEEEETVTPNPNTFYFSFRKEWRGSAQEDIAFTLYNANGTVRQHRFNQRKLSETEWLYEAWLSAAGDYYVVETPVEGYATVYVNDGEHAGEKDRAYNGGTIINYSIPRTGDEGRPILWTAAAAGAVAVMAALAVSAGSRKRRRRKASE